VYLDKAGWLSRSYVIVSRVLSWPAGAQEVLRKSRSGTTRNDIT
jgi:hypothetical protein